MTLINYFSRVHFADGILEDALHSEMERNQCTRPLVVFRDRYAGGTDFLDRLVSGFPYRSKIALHLITSGRVVKSDIKALNKAGAAHKADVLIAFGSTTAIAVAGLAEFRVAHRSDRNGAAKKMNSDQRAPLFFAIPGIENLPAYGAAAQFPADPTHPYMAAGSQPDVIICDPTVTMGETPERTASAAITAMIRCIEAYVSDGFNPPADGIALDGLIRTAQNLHSTVDSDSLDGRRELMAAALNGLLARQKGGGMVQSLTRAFAHEAGGQLDQGAISRLLLPAVLEFQGDVRKHDRYDQLKSVFSIPRHMSLPEGMQQFLAELPLAQSLSKLGLGRSELKRTIRSAQMSWGIGVISEETLMPLLAPIQ